MQVFSQTRTFVVSKKSIETLKLVYVESGQFLGELLHSETINIRVFIICASILCHVQ